MNGAASGGGLGFVTDGDIVIGARHVKFSDTHVAVGQICGYGALRLELNAKGAAFRFLNRSGVVLDSGSLPCRGLTADNLGNLCEGRAGVAQLLSRDLHAPIGEVVHRRYADQTKEPVGQRRTR